MKFEWPTELAQRENGDFYERRLTVLEIALRFALDPFYWILSWLFRFVEFVIVAFLDAIGEVLMALTRTMEFLERKYSTGKDKKAELEYELADAKAIRLANKETLMLRILSLIRENPRSDIKTILIHENHVHCFDYEPLPDTIYSYPIRWIPSTDCDLALEVHHLHSPIKPRDNGVRRPNVQEITR